MLIQIVFCSKILFSVNTNDVMVLQIFVMLLQIVLC